MAISSRSAVSTLSSVTSTVSDSTITPDTEIENITPVTEVLNTSGSGTTTPDTEIQDLQPIGDVISGDSQTTEPTVYTTTTTVPVQQTTTTTPQILPSSDIERTIYGSSTAIEDKASVERGKTERQYLLDRKLRGSIMGVGIYDMLRQFGESGDLNELLDKLRSQLEKNGITQENIDKFIQLLKDNDYFKDKSYEEVEAQLKTVFTTDNDRIYKTIYGFILFRNSLESSPLLTEMFSGWDKIFGQLVTGKQSDIDYYKYWQEHQAGGEAQQGDTTIIGNVDNNGKETSVYDRTLEKEVIRANLSDSEAQKKAIYEKVAKQLKSLEDRHKSASKELEDIKKQWDDKYAGLSNAKEEAEYNRIVEELNALKEKWQAKYNEIVNIEKEYDYTNKLLEKVDYRPHVNNVYDYAQLDMINAEANMNDWLAKVNEYQAIIDDPGNYDYQGDPGYQEARDKLIADGWTSYTIKMGDGSTKIMWKKANETVLQAQKDLASAQEELNKYQSLYEELKTKYESMTSGFDFSMLTSPNVTETPQTVDSLPNVGEQYGDNPVGTVYSVTKDPVTGLVDVFVTGMYINDDGTVDNNVGVHYYYVEQGGVIYVSDEEGNIKKDVATEEPTPTYPSNSGLVEVSPGVWEAREPNGTVITTAYITEDSITIYGLDTGVQVFTKANNPQDYYDLLIFHSSNGTVNPRNINSGGSWIGGVYYKADGTPYFTVGQETDTFTFFEGDPEEAQKERQNELEAYYASAQEVFKPSSTETGKGGLVEVSPGVWEAREPNGAVITTAYITDSEITIYGLDTGTQVFKAGTQDYYDLLIFYLSGGAVNPRNMNSGGGWVGDTYYTGDGYSYFTINKGFIKEEDRQQSSETKAKEELDKAQKAYDDAIAATKNAKENGGGIFEISPGVWEAREPNGTVITTTYITDDSITIYGLETGVQVFTKADNRQDYYDLLIFYLSDEKVNPRNLNSGGYWVGDTYYLYGGIPYYTIGKGILEQAPTLSVEQALANLQAAQAKVASYQPEVVKEGTLLDLYYVYQKYGDIQTALQNGITEEQLLALGFTPSQIEVGKYDNVEQAKAAGVSDITLGLAGIPLTDLIAAENIKEAFKDYTRWDSDGESYDIYSIALASQSDPTLKEYMEYAFGADVTKIAEEYVSNNTKLPDGNWIPNEALELLKESDPEGYDIATTKGWNAYQTYFEENNTELADGTWFNTESLNELKNNDPEGYEILTTKGRDSYNEYAAERAEKYKNDLITLSAYAIGADKDYKYYDYQGDPGYQEARDKLIADGWTSFTMETAAGTKTMWKKAKPELQEFVASGQAEDIQYNTIGIIQDVISGKLDSDTVDRLFGEDFLDTYQPAIEAIGTSANPLEAKQNGVNDEYIDLIWGVGSANAAQQVLDKWQNDIIALNASGVITTNDKDETVVDVGLAAQRGLSYSELQVLTNNGLSISEEEYNKYVSQLSAINSLAGYSSIDDEGNTVYDINKFIADNPTLESIQILTNAGFDADTIAKANDYVNGTQDVLSRLQNTLYGTQGYSDKLILDIKAEELGLIEKAYQEKGLESGIHPSYFGTQLVQGSLLGEEGTGAYHILDYEKFIDSLSDSDKNRLAGAMANDPNISNSFAATVAKLNYEYEKLPQVVQIGIVFIPYIGMPLMASQMVATTIAKATTGQKITAMEIATDAAATALAVLTHIPVKTLPAKLTAKTIEVGAVGTFATDIALNWKEMSVKDQYINIAMMMIPAIGWSRGLGRAIKNKILEGSPEAPIKVAEKQKAILDNVIQVNKDLVSEIAIKDPVVRQEAGAKLNEMQKNIEEYTDTALELAQTRKAIAGTDLVTSGKTEVIAEIIIDGKSYKLNDYLAENEKYNKTYEEKGYDAFIEELKVDLKKNNGKLEVKTYDIESYITNNSEIAIDGKTYNLGDYLKQNKELADIYNKEGYDALVSKLRDIGKKVEIKTDDLANIYEQSGYNAVLEELNNRGIRARVRGQIEAYEKLLKTESELERKLSNLETPLKKSIKDYNDLIVKSIGKDAPSIFKDERVKDLPNTIMHDLNAIANEIVNPRNAVDVYKDTQSLNKQIEDLENRIKQIDALSVNEINGIKNLIQDLKRQIISLDKEARLLELTGETVKVKGKNVKLEIKSLQSKLVEANKKLTEYRESAPISYEVYRKGELVGEAQKTAIERDILEAVENIYEPLYGKESYTKELNILNEKLDSIITMMKEFGISEKETVKMSFDLYDAIIKKDVKKINEVVKQLQLQAGKIPDKMLQLKAGEEIKLLAVRAEDLMSSFKFTQKPPKSEYETVYEAEPVDNSIIREVERIYQSRYEKLTRTMPEARRTSEEIIEYLREKYDTEYFESAYEGRYKDVDDFLDMNRIEQEIRNQKRKYEEELADIKRDIDIHEKEIELTDIFKKKENINKETKDLIDERAEELKRQIEEKKRKLQLAEKEALNIPLEKTRGTEEPVRTEESLITSEKALMPKEKAVEKLVEEIESEIKARKAVEEGRTELERRKATGESIFGIKPKVKISDYAIPESEREHIGAMTPEQKQRLYGVESERVIDARSPYIRTIPDIDTYIKTIPTIIPEPEPISIPITEPITLPQPDIITVPITKPIVQPDTKTVALPQPETQVLPKEEIKEQTKTETITIPVEEPKTEIPKQVIEPPTKEVILPPLEWGEEEVEEWKKKGFPAGTITWKQGMFWKVIPPPYDKDRPISMFDPPIGAQNVDATGEGAAYKTLQILGDKVPEDVKVDLGWTDVIITTDPETKKPRIQYLQGGLETNVGDREPSNYSGMTILNAPSTKDTAKEQYVSKDLRNRGLKKKALSLSEAIEEEPETKMSFESKYNKPKQNNIKRANMIEESNLDRYYLGHKLPDSGLEVQI